MSMGYEVDVKLLHGEVQALIDSKRIQVAKLRSEAEQIEVRADELQKLITFTTQTVSAVPGQRAR